MGTRNNHWLDFLILHGMCVFHPQPLDVKVETCGCTSQYRSPARELQRFRRCAGSRVLRQLLAGSQIDFLKMDGRYEDVFMFFPSNYTYNFIWKVEQKKEDKSHWNGEGHSNAPALSKGLTLYDLVLKRHKTKIQSFGTAVGTCFFCKQKSPPVADVSMMIMKPRWYVIYGDFKWFVYFHHDPWV